MAIDISKLTADVAAVQGTVNSVKAFIAGLQAQIAAIPPSTDPQTQAALDALSTQLEASTAELASAITTNPGPVVTPPAP